MDLMQIIGLGLISTMIILVIKPQRPEMAILISIITGVIIFFLVTSKIWAAMDLINDYIKRANIDTRYMKVLIKIIGIAYIAEFGIDICKDAGQGSIASKIELGAKTIIIVMAIPIITSLLDIIIRIMP